MKNIPFSVLGPLFLFHSLLFHKWEEVVEVVEVVEAVEGVGKQA